MGRGRAPCCAKIGLNKGSWTPEEDMRLIAYIHKYGHGNWRALPKQAGLLRCGKSCRLRWINYLRPDIKRGNFTQEEEETIIKLHDLLGNKWSKIASCLPGRTDNEIKNVWNTHLKKRLASRDHNIKKSKQKEATSPSSSSTSTSCSDQGGTKCDGDGESGSVRRNESNSCEVNGWLEYLEKELGLGGGPSEENQESLVGSWTGEMEGDPVSSYFQKEPSISTLTVL
uniref:Uncharacterized protein n=1 Tax=Ananas comosus var. bracteatus TaxID=296719 RepID=A0A6V7NK02_ANACO|nr:unnamed protein product [Ananas comosus var. bracteatus]